MVARNPQGVQGDYTGWSMTGNLITGNSNVGVKLTQTFHETATYTVTFNLSSVAAFRPIAVADIFWSIHGTQLHRRVTVIDGTSISAPAESVNITLLDANLVTTSPAITYGATITVAKGVRGTSKQPPWLYIGRVRVAPGALGSIAIPDDVGASSVMVRAGYVNAVTTPIPSGTITINQDSVVSAFGLVYDPRIYDWNPILPAATRIQCRVDAGLIDDVAFDAYLGIDG